MSKLVSGKFVKTAGLCALGAVLSFTASGVVAAEAATKKAAAKKSGTFLGTSVMTHYGAIQVSVTVKNGKITKVNAPVYPVGTFRDQQINSQAIPMLEQDVLQAQSSNINNISGASFTAQGFYTSLVSALGKAGLK